MSTITIEINSREAIKQALHVRFGGLANYCAQRGINYTKATTLLRTGYCPQSTLPIKAAITEDLGIEPEVWEK